MNLLCVIGEVECIWADVLLVRIVAVHIGECSINAATHKARFWTICSSTSAGAWTDVLAILHLLTHLVKHFRHRSEGRLFGAGTEPDIHKLTATVRHCTKFGRLDLLLCIIRPFDQLDLFGGIAGRIIRESSARAKAGHFVSHVLCVPCFMRLSTLNCDQNRLVQLYLLRGLAEFGQHWTG